ncbi:hypothetical protein FRAHR75_460058 [Frankia sp. Hr75.2]|nr:hypothetical protein FRAHR75_460058 [Frankia sp. Hr75.2]
MPLLLDFLAVTVVDVTANRSYSSVPRNKIPPGIKNIHPAEGLMGTDAAIRDRCPHR